MLGVEHVGRHASQARIVSALARSSLVRWTLPPLIVLLLLGVLGYPLFFHSQRMLRSASGPATGSTVFEEGSISSGIKGIVESRERLLSAGYCPCRLLQRKEDQL
jgi:hypothetical protein